MSAKLGESHYHFASSGSYLNRYSRDLGIALICAGEGPAMLGDFDLPDKAGTF